MLKRFLILSYFLILPFWVGAYQHQAERELGNSDVDQCLKRRLEALIKEAERTEVSDPFQGLLKDLAIQILKTGKITAIEKIDPKLLKDCEAEVANKKAGDAKGDARQQEKIAKPELEKKKDGPDCPRGQVYDPRIKSCGEPQKLFIERSGRTGCLNAPAKVRFERAPGVKKGLIVPEMILQAGDIIHIPLPPKDWLVTYESKEEGERDHFFFSEGGTKLQIPCYKKASSVGALMYLIDGAIKFITPPHRLKPTKYDIEAQNTALAVEGTEFILESSKGKDSVYVIDGKVSVAAKEDKNRTPVSVLPGQMVSVTSNKVSSPQLALASDLVKEHPTFFADKTPSSFSPTDTITKLKSEPLEKSDSSFKYYLGAAVATLGVLIFRSRLKKKRPY